MLSAFSSSPLCFSASILVGVLGSSSANTSNLRLGPSGAPLMQLKCDTSTVSDNHLLIRNQSRRVAPPFHPQNPPNTHCNNSKTLRWTSRDLRIQETVTYYNNKVALQHMNQILGTAFLSEAPGGVAAAAALNLCFGSHSDLAVMSGM